MYICFSNGLALKKVSFVFLVFVLHAIERELGLEVEIYMPTILMCVIFCLYLSHHGPGCDCIYYILLHCTY
jgi:hypothetical protein